MRNYMLLIVCFILFGCKENNTSERIPVEPDNGIGNGAIPPVFSFSENIEEAHNKTAFMKKKAVSFDIELQFGGTTRLDGKVSMTTNSTKARLDKADGTSIIYDGDQVFISPDSAKTDGARFDIFTWQYFFGLPFKLTDPGTVWEKQEERKLDNSTKYETAKLSFKSNTGDSPDDWYIIYKDPETNWLKAAAYIVTFGQDKQKAEENPHAILYSNYKMIDKVAFATTWSYHNWNAEKGLGDKLGEAKISNIHFFEPDQNFFKKPKDSKPVSK